jgi:hypothetical protein
MLSSRLVWLWPTHFGVSGSCRPQRRSTIARWSSSMNSGKYDAEGHNDSLSWDAPPDPEHVHVSSMFAGCERGTKLVKYTIGNRARRYSGDIGLPRLPLKGDARMPPPVSCFMPRPLPSLPAIAITSYFTDHAPSRNQCSLLQFRLRRRHNVRVPTRKGGFLTPDFRRISTAGAHRELTAPQAARRHTNGI